jgi:carbohydrate kinase (thermoresistant glucokinase family)
MTAPEPLVLVLMGVAGSGKTTVAAILAERLGWAFEEGDALHPPENVEKMRAGHPLDDADRAPWLARVAGWVAGRLDAGACGVITCSALKRRYREAIARGRGGVLFVHLSGSRDQIADRLAARQGHFMPANLLTSQLETLEEPGPDEPAIRVDVGPPPQAVAETVLATLVRRGLLREEAPHGGA